MPASWRIVEGDCRDTLAGLEAGSVQTVVTSPPYFGLRDYGTAEWEGGDATCDHRPPSLHADRNENRQKFGDSWATHGSQLAAHAKRTECAKCGAAKTDRQIGLEPSPDEFVEALVGVFREVRRVLRDDGTVWLNLGDSYSSSPPGNKGTGLERYRSSGLHGAVTSEKYAATLDSSVSQKADTSRIPGVKPKDLLGIPWMVAFALRADGWYLRSEIIWSKLNPMPESVTDRPTKAHEQVFLLSKGPRYFYDADAIRENAIGQTAHDLTGPGYHAPGQSPHTGTRKSDAVGINGRNVQAVNGEEQRRDIVGGSFNNNPRLRPDAGRNKRSVWTVATQPYPGAHFATFPPKLIEPCILAGSSPKACGVCGAPWRRVTETAYENPGNRTTNGPRSVENRSFSPGFEQRLEKRVETVGWEPSCDHDDDTGRCVVLDPFAGAGTTGLVALRHNRSFIGLELSPEYARMARERIVDDAPLLNSVSEVAA